MEEYEYDEFFEEIELRKMEEVKVRIKKKNGFVSKIRDEEKII